MLGRLIFFAFILVFVEAYCPDGSIEYNSNCYIFNSTESGFYKAELSCIQIGGHLVSIHDMFTNGILKEEGSDFFRQSAEIDFWIGGNKFQPNLNWTWIDGSPFDFNDWKNGQPENITGNDCIALSWIDGYWSSWDCFRPKPFVCAFLEDFSATTSTLTMTTPTKITHPSTKFTSHKLQTTTMETVTSSSTPCDNNWVQFVPTQSCYSLYNDSIFINWTDAENYCKAQGGHLPSIHSYVELIFVKDISFISMWLGGYTDDNATTWKWTDKTPMDYVKWYNTSPPKNNQTGSCLSSLNIEGKIGFIPYQCDSPLYLICKKPMKSEI